MSGRAYRVGIVVPSSNTTMEAELPQLLRRRYAVAPETFTTHAARMRMTQVTPEALLAMDAHGERCAIELADADCDVLAYACLVAVVVQGVGAAERAERRLSRAASTDRRRPVVSSAGALTDGIRALGARRVALVAPYAPPLTDLVVADLARAGIEVVARVSLGVTDNRAVGRLDPAALPGIVATMDLSRAEAVVASACVQMPSLAAVPVVERQTGLPVLSAATATTYALLRALGLDPVVPGAGRLLAGALDGTTSVETGRAA